PPAQGKWRDVAGTPGGGGGGGAGGGAAGFGKWKGLLNSRRGKTGPLGGYLPPRRGFWGTPGRGVWVWSGAPRALEAGPRRGDPGRNAAAPGRGPAARRSLRSAWPVPLGSAWPVPPGPAWPVPPSRIRSGRARALG